MLFKGLLYGIGLTGVVILCITPLLGYDWPLQYLKTLKFYQGAKIDPAYQGVFWPELMNIFAPAFSDWIGSSAAMLLTWLFMGAGCVLALVLSRIDPETKRYQVIEKAKFHGYLKKKNTCGYTTEFPTMRILPIKK